ncbi:uncharacterized protein KY384_004935 [Bacidia gigantensis]|uniref:uncharacterized protein n=1 Tax=Bacidia gigantensis TaxID=2732470 RepID=UPI001D057838|nr:uncharacterized protein KY384_004935 [Bacidia gigantensis]KAG8530433.1 hypothetical protein KY384_004935 [Bacidia gigantensis]
MLSPRISEEAKSSSTETVPAVASSRTSVEPDSGTAKDKRSFFSRLVAPKKKDVDSSENNEKESEAGDKRAEGMDAAVFSQPIGYVPQFPSPPKYVKVRSHGKKERNFNRVFLAQELRGRTGVEIAQSGGRSVKSAAPGLDARKDGDAIWAMEFSKDGKYLAAGGKDYVVRVWAVLSSREERQLHESEENNATNDSQRVHLNAPVFQKRTVQEYSGHTASILDLSWSKNSFLLSSSMDKTVRLWHVSRQECLCCFRHQDFVTSIQFHPRDDRFFLAGSLDSKLRLWSIPDKNVAYWNTLPNLITAVAFSPDGKTAIAGCLNGQCLFYETEGLKYSTQMAVRSAHGKNAKGSKITGIQAITYPPDDLNGEVKLLITSNDSRVRVYNLRDKSLELKLKGNENSCSQIHATFSDDAKYIICGSEDRRAYIWPTSPAESEKDKRAVEMFEAHQAIVTAAIMAPICTRQVLSASGDPLYDLCNPPPVTLISRSQSHVSLSPPSEEAPQPSLTMPPTPATADFTKAIKPEESPSYLSRTSHPNGNIIVTADFRGVIKVFRQDCAYKNRMRNNDSALSRKMLGRTNSVATKGSTRSGSRNSLQLNHPSDRILSWRQSINNTTSSFDSFRHNSTASAQTRSISPRKSVGQVSLHSTSRHPSQTTPALPNGSPQASPLQPSPPELKGFPASGQKRKPYAAIPNKDGAMDPLMLQGDQSYMFWNQQTYKDQAANASHLDPSKYDYSSTAGSSTGSVASPGHDASHLGAPVGREITNASRLSSEENSEAEGSSGEGAEVACTRCGGTDFKARIEGARKQILVCNKCGNYI